MLKRQTFTILLSLLALIKCDGDVIECSNYIVLKEACEKLTSETEGQSCVYDGTDCVSSYTACNQYKGTDSSVCSSISTNSGDFRYECVIKNGQCTNYTKLCSDYNSEGKEYCEALSTTDTKTRCVYKSDGTCTAHYKECKDETDSDKCGNNFPSDIKYKCSYDSQTKTCKNVDRKCSEYGSLLYGVDNCWDLKADTEGKSCVLDSSCKEEYKQCGDYTATTIDETTCKNIKPYIQGTNDLDYSHKCVKEGNSCVKKQRDCDDFDYTKDDSYYCTEITFDENLKKTCILEGSGTSCSPKYSSCDAYTGNDEVTCENIIIFNEYGYQNYSIKCDFENDKCVNKPRKCDEYNIIPNYSNVPQLFCQSIKPSDNDKRCLYYGSECLEIPIKCENYKGNTGAVCEKITIYDTYGNVDYSHKCVYEDNSCKTKLRECSDETYQYKCNEMILSDKKRCLYFEGSCNEFYKNCEDYEGNDRIICEKIEPFKSMYEKDDDYECVLEKDNKCTKKKKEEENRYCDYYGSDEELCEMHTPSDPNLKACILIGFTCSERYKYCSEYKGTNSAECTTIIPFDPETGKKDLYSRCKMDSGKCVKETRKCSEYNGYDPAICSKYYADDENKICVLKGNQCTEEYKTCETYTGGERTTCESIKLTDYSKKCVFQEASGSQSAKCLTKAKTCSQFDQDYLGNYCTSHFLNNYKKKCSFLSDSYGSTTRTCSDYTKICEEITFSNESEATEEKCNEIDVSSGRICTLKRDKTGCRSVYEYDLEKEKEFEKEKNQGGNNNENSGGKRYKIILGLLFSLLLL